MLLLVLLRLLKAYHGLPLPVDVVRFVARPATLSVVLLCIFGVEWWKIGRVASHR